MSLHVYQQSMLLMVDLVGLPDMVTSMMDQITALENIKKLEFILWTMNIGELKLCFCYLVTSFWPIFHPFFSRKKSKYEASFYSVITYGAEFCAGSPDNTGNGLTDSGGDVCQGDSGGPLICDDDGKPVLYGVTSWAMGCALTGFPNIYAKVASHLDWIRQNL